jgi:putative ABC transport system permease protein
VITAQMLDVDYDFQNTYQITTTEGRYFSTAFGSDSSAVVINEAMAAKCSDKHPVGKTLAAISSTMKEMIPFRIIGVVKDFNYESLHRTIRPLVLHLGPVRQAATVISIRISTNDVPGTIASIETVWNQFAGGERMNCRFLDEYLARMYRTEQRMGTITTVFSLIAIVIACLGLFGLVSFVTEQKTKEIGMRKVLGASVAEIIVLVSTEFLKWVLYANLISWPIAYLVMKNWLNDFAYRIDISVWIFVLAGAIALVIAIATVIGQVLKVALQNPVTSLRYE